MSVGRGPEEASVVSWDRRASGELRGCVWLWPPPCAHRRHRAPPQRSDPDGTGPRLALAATTGSILSRPQNLTEALLANSHFPADISHRLILLLETISNCVSPRSSTVILSLLPLFSAACLLFGT